MQRRGRYASASMLFTAPPSFAPPACVMRATSSMPPVCSSALPVFMPPCQPTNHEAVSNALLPPSSPTYATQHTSSFFHCFTAHATSPSLFTTIPSESPPPPPPTHHHPTPPLHHHHHPWAINNNNNNNVTQHLSKCSNHLPL